MLPTWTTLERVFTVETIMTPRAQLRVWNEGMTQSEIHDEAERNAFDLIPVERNGAITAVLRRGSVDPKPITQNLLVSSNTAIPHLVALFVRCGESSLLVIHGQEIVGLVTPADLNKLMARTYFYNTVAALEIALAKRIEQAYEGHEDSMLMLLKPERVERIKRRLEDKEIEIGVVHALDTTELVTIIRETESLRAAFGFRSRSAADDALQGLIAFRHAVMHTNNLILNDVTGIHKLHERLARIDDLLRKVYAE